MSHSETVEQFRQGRRPATAAERAEAYREAARTIRTVQPSIGEIAAMLYRWAEVQDAIAEHERTEGKK